MEALKGIEDFVSYVVNILAERPENAQITRREAGSKFVFDVKVDDEDVPRLLGRSGNTVMAVRNLAIAAGEHSGVDVGVEIIEEQNHSRRRDDRRDDYRDRRDDRRGGGYGGGNSRGGDRSGRRSRRF